MCFFPFWYSDGLSVEAVLRRQKAKMLPVNKSDYQRIVVHRKHLWDDALHRFKSGIDFHKYIRVTFVGEPAVDDGGPLREFLHLAIGAIATSNSLFHGREDCRIPTPNQAELEKRTYQYVGEMIAVSLVHGGPAPLFFAPSVVDYIVHGISKVKSTVNEVPNQRIKNKLEMVSLKRSCRLARTVPNYICMMAKYTINYVYTYTVS